MPTETPAREPAPPCARPPRVRHDASTSLKSACDEPMMIHSTPNLSPMGPAQTPAFRRIWFVTRSWPAPATPQVPYAYVGAGTGYRRPPCEAALVRS